MEFWVDWNLCSGCKLTIEGVPKILSEKRGLKLPPPAVSTDERKGVMKNKALSLKSLGYFQPHQAKCFTGSLKAPTALRTNNNGSSGFRSQAGRSCVTGTAISAPCHFEILLSSHVSCVSLLGAPHTLELLAPAPRSQCPKHAKIARQNRTAPSLINLAQPAWRTSPRWPH